MINLIIVILIHPPETSSSEAGENGWETWPLNFAYEHVKMLLLHAVNLQHGTDGFTSPPKEGVLRILSLYNSLHIDILGFKLFHFSVLYLYRWFSLHAGAVYPQIAVYNENNMPVDFLSDTPWEDLICNLWSQNGGQVSETVCTTQWACVAASTIAADRILMLLKTPR
jgi:hypothetical protein